MRPPPLPDWDELSRARRTEFVVLSAMLVALVALSIDAMLPAMTAIGRELAPHDPNRVQLIVTGFVFGMGVGTLFTGPLSDSFGRRPVILGGLALYLVGAALAWAAPTLELSVAARMIQGLGTAGPRVVTQAIVRDKVSGRQMARLMAFIMVIFTLVPAIAPAIGALLIWAAGWRSIYLAFAVFAVLAAGWFALRLPETLPRPARRPFRPRALAAGTWEIVTHPKVRLAIAAISLVYAMLFLHLSTMQPVFAVGFGREASFPYWTALIAVLGGTAGLLNARLVMRFGMEPIVLATLIAQIGVTALALALTALGPAWIAFPVYVAWSAGIFFQAGLTLGNLNAVAMEPMGHLAGLTASVVNAVATVLGVLVAVPIGRSFDGTPVPIMAGVLACAAVAAVLAARLRRR